MKYITKEVRIGIAGIVALCVLVYGINWLKGIHMFQPSSYFYAKFQNVNGLTKSSPVFADGVRVGIVRDIEYDYVNPGNVIVEVELDTELRIPKGSSAELVSELMGGVRMNILLANNPREKYAIGDTIPGTLNNGMMESVAKLMPQIESMLPKLDSILTSLNNIVGDKSIPSMLHSIETTTANLAVVSSQMKGLMSKDIPQLTGKLNTIGDNFVAISGNLKEVDYSAIFQKVDATLANVKIITEKLNRRNLPFSTQSIEENLTDIAGIRIICSFREDIYFLADCLLEQDDITLIQRKDYIENPKENGYRSLHLIVEVPIFLEHKKKMMKVEVQLRTIAMDFWASLEHKLKYKKDIASDQLTADLKKCADESAALDLKMDAIRKEIEVLKAPEAKAIGREVKHLPGGILNENQ